MLTILIKKGLKCFISKYVVAYSIKAEVEDNSLIRADSELVEYTKDRKGLVINRRLFYHKLKEVINDYIMKLSDRTNATLRENFITKMNFICRIPPQD